MSIQHLAIKCNRCSGTGTDDNIQNPDGSVTPGNCLICGGDGYIESALIDTTEVTAELDWIKKKIKKILQKLEIEKEE